MQALAVLSEVVTDNKKLLDAWKYISVQNTESIKLPAQMATPQQSVIPKAMVSS